MDLTVHIPDDIAARLAASGADLSRRALETFVAEEYRAGRLHKPDLRRLLGFETSYEIDGFVKSHGIMHEYKLGDFDREQDTLKALGL